MKADTMDMSSAIDSKTTDAITRFRGSFFLNDNLDLGFILIRKMVSRMIDTSKDITATIATIIFYFHQTLLFDKFLS